MAGILKDKIVVWCLFIILSVLSVTGILIVRVSNETKKLSHQNSAFLSNFSEYMHCLVVVDEPLYAQLGKDAYFAHCDSLLYRGTGKKPPVRPISPTTSSTTSPKPVGG